VGTFGKVVCAERVIVQPDDFQLLPHFRPTWGLLPSLSLVVHLLLLSSAKFVMKNICAWIVQ